MQASDKQAMSSFVCLSAKDNLVVQLSSIIQTTKKYMQVENIQHEQAVEHMRDLETLLCRLMADMIASPMTGRLNLPSPAVYVDDAARQASLHRQLPIPSAEQTEQAQQAAASKTLRH